MIAWTWEILPQIDEITADTHYGNISSPIVMIKNSINRIKTEVLTGGKYSDTVKYCIIK